MLLTQQRLSRYLLRKINKDIPDYLVTFNIHASRLMFIVYQIYVIRYYVMCKCSVLPTLVENGGIFISGGRKLKPAQFGFRRALLRRNCV